jgi:hypothetical protein
MLGGVVYYNVENVFGRQRRHRALQPAAIERVIWIGSKACSELPGLLTDGLTQQVLPIIYC